MNLPYIYTAEELKSMFLAVYSKEEARGSTAEPAFVKQKRLEIKKIVSSAKTLSATLRDMALRMPYLDKLHPFYRDLIDVMFGARAYKHAVAKVGNVHMAIRAIAKEATYAVRIAGEKKDILEARRRYRGRVLDLLEDLAPELEKLREIAIFLKRLPAIDPALYTIVVAGAPNVGKSSFVRCVSSARPEVGEYPFTTRRIHVGHIYRGGEKIQVVDTPGLLDRPLAERNMMERQAILALRHLAGVVLFIVDPTPHAGFPLETQKRVFDEIVANFAKPVVAVVNKIDIATEEELKKAEGLFSPAGRMSTIDCRGAREVINLLLEKSHAANT